MKILKMFYSIQSRPNASAEMLCKSSTQQTAKNRIESLDEYTFFILYRKICYWTPTNQENEPHKSFMGFM